MRKQQDMGKAHWLSKPNLVGGLSVSTPGTPGRQKQGSGAYTFTNHLPKISQLNSSWGRRKPHHTIVGGLVVRGAYNCIRLRPQKFSGKGGKVVYHPYHLRIPHPKRSQGWLGVARTFTLTHVEGQHPTPYGL